MSPARSGHGRGSSAALARHRLVWVDVARGLALLSMFVAHAAPAAGPGGILNLSEHLTAPLFASLVGVSAHLEQRRHGFGRALGRALIRAAALCLGAFVTSFFHAAVVDVLTHLAILTVLMSVLALLPGLLQLLAAAAAAWGGVWLGAQGTEAIAVRLFDAVAPLGGPLAVGLPQVRVWTAEMFTAGPYILPFFVAWALLGAALVRTVQAGGWRSGLRMRGAVGPGAGGRLAALLWAGLGLAVALAAILIVRPRTGHNPIPYEPTWPAFALATGVLLLVLGACAAVVPSELPWLTGVLAVPGSMTLSVYVAHQAYLGWALTAPAGPWRSAAGTDDSWFNVLVLCAGGILLPLLWRLIVRPEPWRRGPLEGPTALLTRSLAR